MEGSRRLRLENMILGLDGRFQGPRSSHFPFLSIVDNSANTLI